MPACHDVASHFPRFRKFRTASIPLTRSSILEMEIKLERDPGPKRVPLCIIGASQPVRFRLCRASAPVVFNIFIQ
jgi:hypothetical protein